MTEPESLHARREREEVERAVEESPLKGKPLTARLRLARETIERYLFAAGGPPVYMRRLRRIEDEISRNERKLQVEWQELAASDPDAFAFRWREIAATWDFSVVNELIAKHNAHYPVEANLGMDVRSGDYKLVRGRDYRLEPLAADWVLARFPTDITEVPAPPAAR